MAWDRYASSAKLSSAARGRSFHLDSIPCAMSSGNSNVICMATPLPFIISRCSAFSHARLRSELYQRRDMHCQSADRTSSAREQLSFRAENPSCSRSDVEMRTVEPSQFATCVTCLRAVPETDLKSIGSLQVCADCYPQACCVIQVPSRRPAVPKV
jgi:hypothetical protein